MLPELQAERQLLAIEAASVPEMQEGSRKSVIDRWVARARGEKQRAKSAVEAFAAAGISVRLIPTPARPRRATGQARTRRGGKRER